MERTLLFVAFDHGFDFDFDLDFDSDSDRGAPFLASFAKSGIPQLSISWDFDPGRRPSAAEPSFKNVSCPYCLKEAALALRVLQSWAPRTPTSLGKDELAPALI